MVFAAAAFRTVWFFPALLIIVGAHYLPFVFLYGMPMFYAQAGLMVAGGVLLAFTGLGGFTGGAWFGAALLVAFALLGAAQVRGEARDGSD